MTGRDRDHAISVCRAGGVMAPLQPMILERKPEWTACSMQDTPLRSIITITIQFF
jgi:hypothetical protein